MKKLLIPLGFLLLALGAVGLFIPVFPTTPFVLLAAGCFSANPGLQKKLQKSPVWGEYLRNYKDKKGLSKKTVILSLSFLWVMLLISGFLLRSWYFWLLFAIIGTAVTAHILYIARPREHK